MKNQAQPKLVALSEGPNIPLDKPILLIGRHQECDIQIPSRKISRRHCCIAQVNEHLVIRDLGSANGIRINGIKVVEGNLHANDELTIGNMCFKVKWTDEPDETVRPRENGIKAGDPPYRQMPAYDESRDEPMPLPDPAHVHPALPDLPAPPNGTAGNASHSLHLPDDIALAPLDPPAK